MLIYCMVDVEILRFKIYRKDAKTQRINMIGKHVF
jgi:hypothetical protein